MIPSVTRFDDFRFALYDLSTGAMEPLAPDSIIDPQFETVPGVVGDRLRSCTFEIPWYSAPRTAPDFDNLQMLAIGRYQAADQELWEVGGSLTLWGILLKPKEGYSKRVVGDSVQIQAVQVEELLRARKVFEYDAGAGKNLPLTFTNEKPDDIAKELVRRCFSGVDIDGNPRDWEWGTLVVEADTSQCVDNINLAILDGPEQTDTLWKRIDDLARTYDFDYQLVPTFVGGAWVFTFRTKAPYGGSDLTTGANQVQIKDLYNLVPSGTRYRDAAFRSTRMYTRGYLESVEDAAAIAAWGIWEGVATGTQLAAAEIALEKARVKEGAEFGFEATGANGMVTWVKNFKAGDLVNRANNRLSVAADHEKIAAVSGRFVDKVLQLTIRWGDREPAVTDRQGGGAYNPDEGDDGLIKGLLDDALLLAEFAPDGTLPVMGDGTYETYVSTATVGGVVVDALRIRGPWRRDTTGAPFLTQRIPGDALKIFDAGSGLGFTITADGDLIGNIQSAGGPADRVLCIPDYDIADVAGGTGSGVRNIYMAGGLVSVIASTASEIRWLGGSDGEDRVLVRNWSVYSDTGGTALRARYDIVNGLQLLDAGAGNVFQVDPSAGHTTWKAGAKWTIEGDQYTLPTAYPAVAGYALTSTLAGVLTWAAPAPAAHDIVGAQHTIAGAQYTVVGATALNTLGLLTPTVTSAANSLVRTDASGYIRATRLEVGVATNYVINSGGALRAESGTGHSWTVGGQVELGLDATGLYTGAASAGTLGLSTRRWPTVFGVAGNYSGDVTIGTAAKGLVMSANTDGWLLKADGTRFVPAAPGPTMIGNGTAQYQVPMTGVSPFAPAWHTTTVTSAANSVVRTDANGYVRATRLEVGSAASFVSVETATVLRLTGEAGLQGYVGATYVWFADADEFRPGSDNAIQLGISTRRWSTVYGVAANFTGDVTIPTAGKGIVMSTNTSGWVPVADGTRFVPSALPKAALPQHAHTYDKTTGFTGYTAGWTVSGAPNPTSNPVRNAAGNPVYLAYYGSAADAVSRTNPTGAFLYIGATEHYHDMTGNSSSMGSGLAATAAPAHTSTNSGSVII